MELNRDNSAIEDRALPCKADTRRLGGGGGSGGRGVALASYTNEVMSLDCLEVRTSKTGVQTGREGSGSFIVAYS